MLKISLEDLILGAQAKLIWPSGEASIDLGARSFRGIATDTRKPMKGELFWALKGEKFDAHDFLEKAIDQGASGLLVETAKIDKAILEQLYKSEQAKAEPGLVILGVSDSLKALQSLAHWVRKKQGYKVIGITGSNGKTTTKEFTQALLQEDFRVHANKGSFNNHFGLPFNILSAPEGTEVLVAEMGMNHAGEITELVKIAEPNLVVCTMVGTAHIENFGSQEGIAKAKSEIYEEAPAQAGRIYNLENPFCFDMFRRALHQKKSQVWTGDLGVFFTLPPSDKDSKRAAVEESVQALEASGWLDQMSAVSLRVKSASLEELTVEGLIGGVEGEATVPVFGRQNLTNLMAAAAIALQCGLKPQKIWQRFAFCRSGWGRNQVLKTSSGATVLFDAYNANPESVAALLENVKELGGFKRKFAVLANMAELGDQASLAHKNMGGQSAIVGFEKVWFYGINSEDFQKGFLEKAETSSDLDPSALCVAPQLSEAVLAEWGDQILRALGAGDLLILKGSRSQKMERLLEPLGLQN